MVGEPMKSQMAPLRFYREYFGNYLISPDVLVIVEGTQLPPPPHTGAKWVKDLPLDELMARRMSGFSS